MDVGNGVAIGKLQAGMALEERHHSRASLQKRVNHGRVVTLAQFMLEVGARQFYVFNDPGAFSQRVARHPGPAAGPGRGTAEDSILFDHDDFLPVPGGCDGCGQTGRTGADNQHITVDNVRLRGCGHGGAPD